MKININQSELLRGLLLVGKAITDKSNMVALSGVLFECKNNKVIITGTDTDISVITMLKAEVIEEGKFLVEQKILTDLVRKLPAQEVSLSYNKEKNELQVVCGVSCFNLVALNAEEFPKLPKVSNENTFILDNNILKEMVLGVGYAAAIDSAKPILEGVLLKIENKELTLVALDGYRLACKKVDVDIDINCEIVVDRKHIMEIAKLLDESGKVRMSISNNHLVICIGATMMISRLLQGKYVDYKALISEDCNLTIETNRQNLLDSIERANLVCRDRDKENNPIIIKITDGKIVINSNGTISKLHEELECDVIKNTLEDDFTIAFNSRYLIDLLKNNNAERMSFQFKTNVNPCIVRKANDINETNLVLPVRLISC